MMAFCRVSEALDDRGSGAGRHVPRGQLAARSSGQADRGRTHGRAGEKEANIRAAPEGMGGLGGGARFVDMPVRRGDCVSGVQRIAIGHFTSHMLTFTIGRMPRRTEIMVPLHPTHRVRE